MATIISVALTLFLVIEACNNNGSTSPVTGADSNIKEPAKIVDSVYSGCYSQIINRDSSSMQIVQKANMVNGSVTYNLFQKDRNDGELQGEISGDIIRGWYLFKSEGILSVREVAWKVNGNDLWPASGEMIQNNDTMRFAKPRQLQFDNTRPFKKVPCII